MPKVVLLIGPCGAGKTSALGRMRAVLGDRVGEVAVLETDTTYMMIDPTWSLSDRRYWGIATRVAARIATEFIEASFDWVVVGSNGLQDRDSVSGFIAQLPGDVDVHHIFLDPSVAVVQAHIAARAHATDAHKTPDWLVENVKWMRSFHNSWSAVIDNSELSIDETVDAIYETVEAGKGRVEAWLEGRVSGARENPTQTVT